MVISSSPARSSPHHLGNESDSLHRCVLYWLRSSIRVNINLGTVAQIQKFIPHQHLGDAGRHQCNQLVPATSPVTGCASDV